MDAFRCLCLSVLARAEDSVCLPPYQGSALRGAFGYALKHTVGVVRNQECAACLLKDSCIYSYVFETPVPQDSETLLNTSHVPHPFIFNPPPPISQKNPDKSIYPPDI